MEIIGAALNLLRYARLFSCHNLFWSQYSVIQNPISPVAKQAGAVIVRIFIWVQRLCISSARILAAAALYVNPQPILQYAMTSHCHSACHKKFRPAGHPAGRQSSPD